MKTYSRHFIGKIFLRIILVLLLSSFTTCIYAQRGRSRYRSRTTQGRNQSSVKRNTARWRMPTSAEDLQNRIVGTVWTCTPPHAEFWYRLSFDRNIVKLQHSVPNMQDRFGLKQQWMDYRICTYVVRNSTTWNTGEPCISADLYMTERLQNVVMGSLMFFENGDIEFSWDRGVQGGKARFGEAGF